ncbi:hypothetical protein [Halostella litorea]|uniref:hypothetical protein n=1 Tax=Halostella litorea TaxID=2528831 RepID=UPI001091E15A|nr:hypothetical protein [Halostella litorea]
MVDDTSPSPPNDLPDEVVNVLQELDGHDLREAIVYAQELLYHRRDPTIQIEPQPGEEIVSVEEHDGYTAVVKRQPCAAGCPDCPHGPYLYHVTEETHTDGSTHYHWSFVGSVVDPDE